MSPHHLLVASSRTCALVALLTTWTASTASTARAANPLQQLDQLVADYEVTLTGDTVEDEGRVTTAMQQLEDIIAAADALDDKDHARGLLRALEAYLILADALLAAPCPETLGPDACAVYRSLMAEEAAGLAQTAMATATSLHSGGKVKGADRKRFDTLTASGSDIVGRAAMAILEAPVAGHSAPPSAPAAATDPGAGWLPPPTEAATTDRFALVWGNAELYRSPDDPAPLRTYAYGDDRREDHPDAMYVVHVLSNPDAAGPVEVRLGGNMQWDRHCVGSNLMPYWAAIRAWVDPADFVPVLAEEVVVEFDDGSGVHLLLGTPLVGDRAWLDGQLVPVPGDAARATTYTGDAARLDDRSISAYFPWGIAGTIGGEPFTARQPDFQYGDEFYVTSFTAGGDGGGDGGGGGGLITLDHRCGEVRFRVGADVGPGEDAALAALFGSMAEGDWVSFPAGTRLYWIDGTAAGVVTQDQGVEAHRVHGELMRCVDEPIVNSLRGMTATVVPLCARPGDVVEPAAKAPATAPEATP